MKIRSAIKIPGGKYYQINHILSNFPTNYVNMNYIEPYGGAGNIIINKNPSKNDVYNDVDTDVASVFQCLKTDGNSVKEMLKNIEYSEKIFTEWRDKKPSNNFECAIREIVCRRMSRGGLKTNFCWSNRKRGGRFGELNAWETFKENHLPLICERFKKVEVFNENAIDVILLKDGANALFYCDPPYLQSTRTANKVYTHEMTEGDHRLLAEVLQSVSGKVIVSGYPSKLYNKLYKNWRMLVKEMPNHASQSKKKQRRLECLWLNYGE